MVSILLGTTATKWNDKLLLVYIRTLERLAMTVLSRHRAWTERWENWAGRDLTRTRRLCHRALQSRYDRQQSPVLGVDDQRSSDDVRQYRLLVPPDRYPGRTCTYIYVVSRVCPAINRSTSGSSRKAARCAPPATGSSHYRQSIDVTTAWRSGMGRRWYQNMRRFNGNIMG